MAAGQDPRVPMVLGVAGLIPFWGLALACITGITGGVPSATLSFALAAYAATILSFLGGMRWGIAAGTNDQARVDADYIVAIVPQLIGWVALLLPDPWRMSLLGIVILALGPFDQTLSARGLAPGWFGRLRMGLSLGAGVAVLLVAILS